jgi:hypothetical protein
MIKAVEPSISQQHEPEMPSESRSQDLIRFYPFSISFDQCLRFFSGVFLLLFILSHTVHADPWGPWSVSEDAPAMLTQADRKAASPGPLERPDRTIAATPFLWMLTFYQKTIGPVVSGRCSMYPTCSQYSVEAIRRHGPVVGIVMTADRMMHELDEQDHAPLIRVGGRYRYSDPVRNNDFWWFTE